MLKEIIELPSICFKDENSHDYECHYSELVDKLTSYLVLDTANHFKRKLQINCVLGKERSLEHPYILISTSETVLRSEYRVYILIIFDFKMNKISISLVVRNHEIDVKDINEIFGFSTNCNFPNGIGHLSEFINDPIPSNLPNNGFFCCKLFTRDDFSNETDFDDYITTVVNIYNKLLINEQTN